MSELAGRCHWCGVVGEEGERWLYSDTCDGCSYLKACARYGNSASERRRAKSELMHWASAHRVPKDPRHPANGGDA